VGRKQTEKKIKELQLEKQGVCAMQRPNLKYDKYYKKSVYKRIHKASVLDFRLHCLQATCGHTGLKGEKLQTMCEKCKENAKTEKHSKANVSPLALYFI